ncbi:DUF5012 domain-containing protein [Zunongwangia sp. F363]|uniref:DUF5012 domain-containing protein n=1 Tax=Autumnicola tepida TaxID=3075595 RepID=A0ABU3CBP8_9FLAO|nr:BT_2262 family domain-containing protein [Zunongwangia sp. F363]MDT0643761.1 DUF5012 domain-containing protein [Zunongwangia sp. F363]
MKKIFLILNILALGMCASCDTEDTAGVSRITNFAVFNLEGDQEILLEKGEEYVEPGATAEEAGEPVEVSASSSGVFRGGELDTDVADIYNVFYTAVNQDGYEASATRTVVVADNGDLVEDISGLYRSTVVRDGTADPQYANMEYVLIWEKSDGTFEISDGIGGYYMFGRNYGVTYAARGATVTVNGLNDYSFGPAFSVGAFGGSAEITEMTVDPDAGTIDFTTVWDAGYSFAVHLEQVEL